MGGGIIHAMQGRDVSPGRPSIRRWTWLRWPVLLAAVGDWLGLRTERLDHSPAVLAAIVALAVLLQLLALSGALARLRGDRRGRGPAAAEALAALGLAIALSAGMANWVLGLQGFAILHEGEAVPLHGGSHLQHFEGGPLARVDEMEVVLALEELELVPDGRGGFLPASRIRVERVGEPPARLQLGVGQPAESGVLRFFQGAFGFAPRIVITRNGEAVFDRVVPFTSERRGRSGIAFEGHFRVERLGLEADGQVDVSSLDDGMRGHATLVLELRREGEPLGQGRLRPGHFAELGDGWAVGFAGLERWSEIDLARRNYGGLLLAGTGLAIAGAALWPLARWRGRRA